LLNYAVKILYVFVVTYNVISSNPKFELCCLFLF